MKSVLRRFHRNSRQKISSLPRNLYRRLRSAAPRDPETQSDFIQWHLEYRYDNRLAGVPLSTKYSSFVGTKAEVYEKLRELRDKEDRNGIRYEVELFPDLTSAFRHTQGQHVHYIDGVRQNHSWAECPQNLGGGRFDEEKTLAEINHAKEEQEKQWKRQQEFNAKREAERKEWEARQDELLRSDPAKREARRKYIRSHYHRVGTRGANSRAEPVAWKKEAQEKKIAKELKAFNDKYGED